MTDLREQAIRGIKNYMADELSEVDKNGLMFEYMHEQAEKVIAVLDRAIELTKNHQLGKNF